MTFRNEDYGIEKRALAKHYGVRDGGRIRSVINRIIRQECVGGNEVLDTIEYFGAVRKFLVDDPDDPVLGNMHNRVESIRDAMEDDIINRAIKQLQRN